MIRIGCLSLILALGLSAVSCSGNKHKNSILMDEGKNSFVVEDEKIEYVIPTDIANWAVASPEAMPDGMQFFGVDRENGICVGLFKPEKPHRSPHTTRDFSDTEFRNILRQVAGSDSSTIVAFENLIYSDTIFLTANAKKFLVQKGVIDKNAPKDTVNVFYNGFIFDKGSEPYGIVVLSSTSPISESGENNTNKYLQGLILL